jgi:hypothetical protein
MDSLNWNNDRRRANSSFLSQPVSAGVEGAGTNSKYKHPRASTMKRFNDAVKATVPSMGWRTKKARAYDVASSAWTDLKIRTGVALTTLDGDVVASTDGSSVRCQAGAPTYSTR